MNKQKRMDYDSPTVNVLEVRFEGVVCQSNISGGTELGDINNGTGGTGLPWEF